MSSDCLLLDTRTPNEKALMTIAAIFGGAVAISLYQLVSSESASPGVTSVFYFSLAACPAFLVLRFVFQECYLIDFEKNQLILRRQFCGTVSQRVVESLHAFQAVVINAERNRTQWGAHCLHGLSLIDTSGEAVEVLSLARDSYNDRLTTANAIASRLGIEMRDCDQALRPSTPLGSTEPPRLESHSRQSWEAIIPNLVIAVIVFLVMTVFVLALPSII